MHALLPRRTGMTLVELLVVVAIIGLLAVTVLPNVANTAESRRSQEAARVVSSFAAKAQSRAVGRAEPAGLMVVATGTASFAAVDLFLADVPPPYRGDTVDASVIMSATSVVGQSTWRSGTVQPVAAMQTGTSLGVAPYDLIRFAGRGPFYEIVSISPPALVIRFRGSGRFGESDYTDNNIEDFGQALANTPWPSSERLPFEIFRKPMATGSPLAVADGRVIDVFWSGYGPPFVDAVAGTYRQFTMPGSRVTVLFDGTGRLRQIVEVSATGTFRRAITGPVFLLVGRVDRATGDPNAGGKFNAADDSSGANWQYPDSWWIGIDPMTGVAKSAECTPGAATVLESQKWIRQALLGSGR